MRLTPGAVPQHDTGAAGTDELGSDDSMRETHRVDTCKSGSEVADHIRRKIIYDALELEELGIRLADITDNIRLFDEDGLNLDSIDALEILAGVQREFGLSLPDADQVFIDEHCATVARLTSMVLDMSRSTGARESTAARDVDETASGASVGKSQDVGSANS